MKPSRRASVWHRLVRVWDTLCGLCEHSARALRRSLNGCFKPFQGKCHSRRKPASVPLQLEHLETRWVMTAVAFSAATYTANESDSSATIVVTEDSAPSGTVTVDYATSNGSATAG